MRIVLWRLHCVGLLVLGFAAESLFGVADDPPREPVGAIYGVVRFTGKVPPAKQIMTTDGGVLQHHDLIVDSKTKGLRFVFATLEDAPVRPKLEKAPAVLLDQRDMVFLPRVIAVQDGQPVRLENNDLCNHS